MPDTTEPDNNTDNGSAVRLSCVHIGLPKTATTTMQKHLFPHHSGIHYFGKFAHAPDHFPTAEAERLREEFRHRRLLPLRKSHRARLRQTAAVALADGLTPLWSQEGLCGGRPAQKRRAARLLHEALGPCRVFMFVRRPLALMESLYFQSLKGFNRRLCCAPWAWRIGLPPKYFGLTKWLEAVWSVKDPLVLGTLRWQETVEVFTDEFGSENFMVQKFEDFCRDPGACIAETCRFMNIDADEARCLISDKRENERWTTVQLDHLEQLEMSRRKSLAFLFWSPGRRRQALAFSRTNRDLSGERLSSEFPTAWQDRVLEFCAPNIQYIEKRFGVNLQDSGYLQRNPRETIDGE